MANSERSIEKAVAELEKRSIRSRSILLVGTAFIVASLFATVIYLNRLRAEAESLAAHYKTSADDSLTTLKATRSALRRGDLRRAHELLGLAISQTQDLANEAAQVAPPPLAVVRDSRVIAKDPVRPSNPAPQREAPTELGPAMPELYSILALVYNNTSEDLVCGPAIFWRSSDQHQNWIRRRGHMRYIGAIRCEPPVTQVTLTLQPRERYEFVRNRDGSVQLNRLDHNEP